MPKQASYLNLLWFLYEQGEKTVIELSDPKVFEGLGYKREDRIGVDIARLVKSRAVKREITTVKRHKVQILSLTKKGKELAKGLEPRTVRVQVKMDSSLLELLKCYGEGNGKMKPAEAAYHILGDVLREKKPGRKPALPSGTVT